MRRIWKIWMQLHTCINKISIFRSTVTNRGHNVSVFSRESKRTLPVTKLNTDAIYLNNFSKMRVNLAVNTLSQNVAVEMEENEIEVTKSTQEYIKIPNDLFTM
jgi:hypothetical protein